MAYTDKELSTQDGEIYEMYDFIRGTWAMYLTTRATEVRVSDLQVYEPAPITRGKIRQGEDIRKDVITITVPRGHALAAQFVNIAPEATTSVTIRRNHRTLDFSEAVVIWKGRVIGAEPKGQKTEISCESIYTSMRRIGPRFRAELICQHVLYSAECGADQPAMRVDDTIASMTSPTVLEMNSISGSYDSGWFSGGILEHEGDSRYIIAHSGSTITISRPMQNLSVGDEVALYPGCDRIITTCRDKFDNKNNYLGFPWFPEKNPFQVSIKG